MSKSSTYIQSLYLLNRALISPLEAFFTLLIFILSKELNATILQLTILASAKPIASLFAFFISSSLIDKPHLSRRFLIGCTFIGSFPCLLFSFTNEVWFYIAAYACFMIALRASYPIWIELLKNQFGANELKNIIAKGSVINYCIIIAIPLILANVMDQENGVWKKIFFGFGILSLCNILLFFTLKRKRLFPSHASPLQTSMNSILTFPWKEGWRLCRENLAFTSYQILFFLGGAGLVILQPILPIYFKDVLHLSYTQLIIAFSVCKGIGFVFSSPLWVRWSKSKTLYLLNGAINLFSSLFIAFILASSGKTSWLFLAYLLYGAMQAGCELSWNVSGPYFAKDKESILYSSLNLFFVGLRGCVCPFLGQLIFLFSGPFWVLAFAGGLCLFSIVYAIWLETRYKAIYSF